MDYPLSLDVAHHYREKLMEERKYYINNSRENMFERPFSLCEH